MQTKSIWMDKQDWSERKPKIDLGFWVLLIKSNMISIDCKVKEIYYWHAKQALLLPLFHLLMRSALHTLL